MRILRNDLKDGEELLDELNGDAVMTCAFYGVVPNHDFPIC